MTDTEIKVQRWQSQEEPDEAKIRTILQEEGLEAYRWSNGPGDVYSTHSHSYHKVVYVVAGTIEFSMPDQADPVVLGAGDCLEIPAGVRHGATVGSGGVVCLEGHRYRSWLWIM